MSAQPLFDGTFSLDAVSSVAHARVTQLHDEAMATIATLATTWDAPAPTPDEDAEPVTYREPATWSVEPDEDELYGDDDEDDDEVRVLPLHALPPLLLRPRGDRQLVTL